MFDYETSESHKMSFTNIETSADTSLARPRKETSYSDQDLQNNTKTYGVQTTAIYSDQDLQNYTKTYGVQTAAIYFCCVYEISLGILL